MREQAENLGREMANEDGVARAVEAVAEPWGES